MWNFSCKEVFKLHEKEKMRKYLVVFEKTKTGYSAYVSDLPGCIATGKTSRT